MAAVNNMQPNELGRRVLYALVLLLVVSYGAKLIYTWLQPLIPTLVVGVILLMLFSFVLGRFRG